MSVVDTLYFVGFLEDNAYVFLWKQMAQLYYLQGCLLIWYVPLYFYLFCQNGSFSYVELVVR